MWCELVVGGAIQHLDAITENILCGMVGRKQPGSFLSETIIH